MSNENTKPVKKKPVKRFFNRIGGGIKKVGGGIRNAAEGAYGDFDGNFISDAKTVLKGVGDLATGGNLLTGNIKINAANKVKDAIKNKVIRSNGEIPPQPSKSTIGSHNSAVNATKGAVTAARTTNPYMATHNDPNPLPGMKKVFSDLKNTSEKIKESDLAQAYKSINSKINLKELVNQPDQAIKGFIKEFGIPETIKQFKKRFKKPKPPAQKPPAQEPPAQKPPVQNKKKGGMMKKKGYAKGGMAKKTPAKKASVRRKVRGVGAATRGFGRAMKK